MSETVAETTIEPVKSGAVALVSPCHNAPLYVSTTTAGSAYMTYETPEEIGCTAASCYNTWSPTGVANEWNV